MGYIKYILYTNKIHIHLRIVEMDYALLRYFLQENQLSLALSFIQLQFLPIRLGRGGTDSVPFLSGVSQMQWKKKTLLTFELKTKHETN